MNIDSLKELVVNLEAEVIAYNIKKSYTPYMNSRQILLQIREKAQSLRKEILEDRKNRNKEVKAEDIPE